MTRCRRVVVLSGGVGGARLVHGLAQVLPPDALTAIVNTGDDFEHWGLAICPDLDTVMYTLAGLAHEARGWGLVDESFGALDMIRRYGGADWFQLGDRDLATHITRTQALRAGGSLSNVTATLCRSLGVTAHVIPMADHPRRTLIDTGEGDPLLFQEWFVRERCRPPVRAIAFRGTRAPAPDVIPAIADADLIVIAPSNPYVSIDPILTLDGVADAARARPVIAVSPIVGGQAVKGPLASMIPQLAGTPASARAIVDHYRDRYGALVDAILVHHGDDRDVTGISVTATDIVMNGVADRARLARELLALARPIL